MDATDWNEFRDSRLALRAPAYLRQQKSMMFFKAPKKRRPEQNIVMFSVSVLTHQDWVDTAQIEIEEFNPRVAQPGTEWHLVRKGKPDWLDNGLELLADMRFLSTGNVDHHLTVVFQRSNANLMAGIIGDGELECFENVARSIIQSIRLVEGDEAQVPVKCTRSAAAGLKRADKTRLSDALMKLPPDLAYLRKPILAIAKEDQDLLGAGEADIGPLVKALRQRAGKTAIAAAAIRDADALSVWLKAMPDHTGAWAVPAWFVEGALRGASLFLGENQ
ncbi:MAG: hypothetical protein ACM359_10785 [Bacillota bacterium]